MLVHRVVQAVLALGTAALVAGCYTPKLKNFGFACDSSSAKPCPNGYFCNNGFCDDGTGGSPPAGTGGNGSVEDMAMSSGGSGGGGGGGSAGGGGGGGGGGMSSNDMAMPVQDMAQSIPDMAKSPDMVVVSSCKHDECTTGSALSKSCSACATAVCNKDTVCCNSSTGQWDDICVSEVNKYCTTKTCP